MIQEWDFGEGILSTSPYRLSQVSTQLPIHSHTVAPKAQPHLWCGVSEFTLEATGPWGWPELPWGSIWSPSTVGQFALVTLCLSYLG